MDIQGIATSGVRGQGTGSLDGGPPLGDDDAVADVVECDVHRLAGDGVVETAGEVAEQAHAGGVVRFDQDDRVRNGKGRQELVLDHGPGVETAGAAERAPRRVPAAATRWSGRQTCRSEVASGP